MIKNSIQFIWIKKVIKNILLTKQLRWTSILKNGEKVISGDHFIKIQNDHQIFLLRKMKRVIFC